MIRRPIIRAGLASGLVIVVSAALAASAPAKARFNGKLCAVPTASQLAAAHITDPCIDRGTRTFGGGSISARVTNAVWGTGNLLPSWLAVTVQRTLGKPAAVAQAQAAFRKSVKLNGAKVAIGEIASVRSQTYSGTRHKGKLLFIDHGYDVIIDLNDDDPAASPATVKAVLISIGRAVAAKL